MASTIKICMGSSCFARGNKRNLKLIEEYIAKYHIDCALTGRGVQQALDTLTDAMVAFARAHRIAGTRESASSASSGISACRRQTP